MARSKSSRSGRGRPDSFYRLAIQGVTDTKTGEILSHGLRSVARGFASSDGYNIINISSWTPSQKAKITRYWHELHVLTAQPKYAYKPKNKKELPKIQKITQADTKLKWKVAFVPHVPKKLKSGKRSKRKPDIKLVGDSIRVKEKNYRHYTIRLNPQRLVKDVKKEIARAIKDNAPKATRFTIGADENEMPGLSDKDAIVERVQKLIHQYDGKRPLPKGSGNTGDAPKFHKWNQWLHNLIAYEFDKTTFKQVSNAMNEFDKGRRELQKKKRAMRKRLKYKKKGKRK